MNQEPGMYSLDQVAERLGLHVRTVRAYVRAGRLRAIRIGKQYRVAREELEALVGAGNTRDAVARRRRAEASCVIQMDAVTENTVLRAADHLRGAVNRPRDDGSALRVETIYDPGRAHLKVIVIGSLPSAAHIFGLLGAILDA
ncbi:MAG TPA: helix-turn-helix domain-containing protein [Steroidobacteraceae bacterium]